MSRFVVVVTNNEGGCPATIHETLDDARKWIRNYFAECHPPLSEQEQEEANRDLAELTGDYVQGVRGSQAWKEWLYIAPLATAKTEEGGPT